MYTVKNYVLADSLEQAYELKQKSRNNIIVGGNLWLKMGHRNILNAIDLSLLHLDQIEEDEDGFHIGCMVTLRELETHAGLNQYFDNLFQEAVKHIVGVQFRNCATVGGSVFPRFGFSDVLTAFLACDSYVDLCKGGRIPIGEFVKRPLDTDILTGIYIMKDDRRVCYQSFRMTKTDFPTLTCALIRKKEKYAVVLGARPKQAVIIDDEELLHPEDPSEQKRFAEEITEKVEFGTNMRGSAQYRKALAKIFIERGIETLQKESTEEQSC